MTYNYHGAWESATGVGAPLYSSTATIYTVHRTVQFWLSRVNSTEKLILGIPLYAPMWTLTSNDTSLGAPGTAITPYPRYYEICEKIANGWTRVWDDVQKAPIAFGDGMWSGYEDAQSVQEKINYLIENGLGGVFTGKCRSMMEVRILALKFTPI